MVVLLSRDSPIATAPKRSLHQRLVRRLLALARSEPAEQVGETSQAQLARPHGRFVVDALLRLTLEFLMLGQVDVLLVEESHFMRIALERIVLDEDFHGSPFWIDLVETVVDTYVTVRRVDSSCFAFEEVRLNRSFERCVRPVHQAAAHKVADGACGCA